MLRRKIETDFHRAFGLLSILVVLAFLTLPSLADTSGSVAVLPPGAAAQQASYEAQFGAAVDLVVLPVSVLDSAGLRVADISSEDFIVLEDGVEQDVAILLSPEEAPLDIALLMDMSDSMRSMEEAARSSAVQFLDQLSEDDCVFLLRFNAFQGPGIWGGPENSDIRAAINETPMQGGSAVRDAIAEGFYRLEHDFYRCRPEATIGESNLAAPRRRPALVVVTDGSDEHSALTFEGLLDVARQRSAPFIPVGFGDITLPAFVFKEALSTERWDLLDVRMASAARHLSELQDLARVSGGQLIEGGGNKEKLGAAYGEVIRWLRSYYLVGYYPNPPTAALVASELPSWHEVEVRLRRPGYRVHTRAGHYRTSIDVGAARKYIETGIDLIARGEPENALVEFGLAMRADPYSWEAHYHRGGALILAGKTNDAQQALLRAARLSPGRGDVHKLAFGVSLELDDYETAWDQAVRAHQAEMDMTEELLFLRQQATEPPDIEERLQAPRLYIESSGAIDLVDQTALRLLTLSLVQDLSQAPEIGLIDRETPAGYRLLIRMKKLSERSPRKLEVDLELWESGIAGGDRVYRRGITLFDIEDRERTAGDLSPHIAELRSRLAEQR